MDPITAILLGLAVAGGGYAAFKTARPTTAVDPNAALIGAASKAAQDAQKFFRGAGSKLSKFGNGTARQARRNYNDVVNAPEHAVKDVKHAAQKAAKKLRKKLHL